jgi:hypothetical protein
VNLPILKLGSSSAMLILQVFEAEVRYGREESTKLRSRAIVLLILCEGEYPIVRVLPVMHTLPTN